MKRRSAVMAALAAVALLVAPRSMVSAQDSSDGGPEPVVVVSLGSISKLMNDVNYLTGTLGQAQAGGMFTMMAGTFTQGIDNSKPLGVMVLLENGEPKPLAVIPTSDVKTVLKRLEAQTGPADELDDGTLVIALGATTVFIKQAGEWAILAPERGLLELAPADPMSLFEGMGNAYDVAVRLQIQQVPPDLRKGFVAQIRQGFEQAMAQQGPEEAEAARQMAEGSLIQLEQLINEADTLQLGFNIDQDSKQLVFDGLFTAVPDSSLAALYGGQQSIPSQFASVIRDDAAAFYHVAASIPEVAVSQTRAMLGTYMAAFDNAIANDGNLNSQQQKELSETIKKVSELALSSIDEGKADFGALLLANQSQFQAVLGGFVSDGKAVEDLLKDLAKKIPNDPNAPRFSFNDSTYNNVSIHVIEADIPENEDEARRVFGNTLRVRIGTADKAVYAAVGKGSFKTLKELIDSSGKDNVTDRPIGQFRLSLMPILQFANSIESNDAITAMIDALSRAPDQGEVVIVSESIENGSQSRLTIGEGLLQAIGAAIRQSQQAAFQNQF